MPADPAAPPPACRQPHLADADAHVLRWQAHVDAGRIGHRAAPDPSHRANLARTETMLGLTRGGAIRGGV